MSQEQKGNLNKLFDKALFGPRVYVHYNVFNIVQDYQKDK